MGWPMATRLKEDGFHVLGIDVFEQTETEFNGQTTSSDEKHRCLSSCDALFIMVVNADQVRSVLFGAGSIESLGQGACIVQMSTIAPDDAVFIAIMAAGTPDALTKCRQVFEVMSKVVFQAGQQPGQGAAMKAVNQLLCGVHIAAAAEAMALAEKSGIDTSTMLAMLQGSSASSWMLKDRGPRMIAEPGDVTSVIDIFCKDMGIVCDSAKASKAFTPLAETARQLFVSSSERGEGKFDDSQLIRIYRLLNGMA